MLVMCTHFQLVDGLIKAGTPYKLILAWQPTTRSPLTEGPDLERLAGRAHRP